MLVLKKVAAVMGELVSGVDVYRLMVSVALAARLGKTPEMTACRALLPKVCLAFMLTCSGIKALLLNLPATEFPAATSPTLKACPKVKGILV